MKSCAAAQSRALAHTDVIRRPLIVESISLGHLSSVTIVEGFFLFLTPVLFYQAFYVVTSYRC